MGAKTGIEWTDSTGNPLLARRVEDGKVGFHCVKVSPECAMCYAETFNERDLPNRGTGLPYTKASGGAVEIFLHRPAFDAIRKLGPVVVDEETGETRPRRVFWVSMSDLFGEFVPSPLIQESLDEIVSIGEAKGHRGQILTKRPGRMLDELREWSRRHGRRVPPFVWPGFSAGDRKLFAERWAVAREIRSVADGPLWCSYEPAIGPPDLGLPGVMKRVKPVGFDEWSAARQEEAIASAARAEFMARDEVIDWLVAGGESGARSRPPHPDWFRSARDQAAAGGVPFFFKQWGEWEAIGPAASYSSAILDRQAWRDFSRGVRVVTADGSISVPKAPFEDWWQRDWPDDAEVMLRRGKKYTGRELDGATWSEFPEERAGV